MDDATRAGAGARSGQERPPHAATVVQRSGRPPHAATVVQRSGRPPHAATVVQRSGRPPHAAAVVQPQCSRAARLPVGTLAIQKMDIPLFVPDKVPPSDWLANTRYSTWLLAFRDNQFWGTTWSAGGDHAENAFHKYLDETGYVGLHSVNRLSLLLPRSPCGDADAKCYKHILAIKSVCDEYLIKLEVCFVTTYKGTSNESSLAAIDELMGAGVEICGFSWSDFREAFKSFVYIDGDDVLARIRLAALHGWEPQTSEDTNLKKGHVPVYLPDFLDPR